MKTNGESKAHKCICGAVACGRVWYPNKQTVMPLQIHTQSMEIMDGRMTYRQRADMHDWPLLAPKAGRTSLHRLILQAQVCVSITNTDQCCYRQTPARNNCCTSILWSANSADAEACVSVSTGYLFPLIIWDTHLSTKWSLAQEELALSDTVKRFYTCRLKTEHAHLFTSVSRGCAKLRYANLGTFSICNTPDPETQWCHFYTVVSKPWDKILCFCFFFKSNAMIRSS